MKVREKRSALGFALLLLLISLSGAAPSSAQTRREVAPEDYIKSGNQRYARAEYDAAIAEYGRVSPEAGARYAQSLYNMGVCYYELWRTEDAIAMYRRAVAAMKGDYPKALYALGVALHDSGRLAEAEEAYRRAIKASAGEHLMAHYMLGLLVMNEGSHEEAANLFRESIRRAGKGHFPASHTHLGVMLARLGRLREA
jgi:tetratricopeptide (TPR) repeat protein